MKPSRILALSALLAMPLAAQQPQRMGHDMTPHMTRMQEMMEPMMRGMAYAPQHLLALGDSLNLTAQQVARLTALRDAAKTAHDAAHAEAQRHMQALADAFQAATPDANAVKQHFDGAHAAMGKAHWTMLAAAAEAKALLTAEQRRWVEQHVGHH